MAGSTQECGDTLATLFGFFVETGLDVIGDEIEGNDDQDNGEDGHLKDWEGERGD